MRKWLFPCNLNDFDILGCCLKYGFVDYGTNLGLVEGDEVFIYTGAPYSAIFLKCRVRALLNYEETIDDSEFDYTEGGSRQKKARYVRLVPVKNYLNLIDKVNYKSLQENGLEGVHYQIQLPKEVAKYLDSLK